MLDTTKPDLKAENHKKHENHKKIDLSKTKNYKTLLHHDNFQNKTNFSPAAG